MIQRQSQLEVWTLIIHLRQSCYHHIIITVIAIITTTLILISMQHLCVWHNDATSQALMSEICPTCPNAPRAWQRWPSSSTFVQYIPLHLTSTKQIVFFLQIRPNKDLFFLVKKIAELPPFAEKILNKVFEGPSMYELIEKLLWRWDKGGGRREF